MQLARNGRTLQFDVTGNGAEAVIFIPALGTTRDMWRSQVPAFESEYTVITYDPAGHDPGSVYPGQPALSDYADDLLALVDAVHSHRPHLVGLSLGGMIAQEYAIRYRDRVQTVTAASTTSEYPQPAREQMRERAAEVERQGMSGVVQARLEAWLTEGFRESHPEVVSWVRDMLVSADPQAYAQAARVVSTVDTTAQLPKVACPVLILDGSQDGSLPPGAAMTLASHIRVSQSETIPNAAHLCNVEAPDAFNGRVRSFVSGIIQDSPSEAGVPGLPEHGSELPASGPPRYV